MIEQLKVQNYRSCIDTELNLQKDLTVLIGPNGSGKTNILKSIMLLQKIAFERRRRYFEDPEFDSSTEAMLKATFRVGNRKTIFTSKVNLVSNEHNDDSVLSSTHSWYAKDFTNNAKRFKIPLGFYPGISPNMQRAVIAGHLTANQARMYARRSSKVKLPADFREAFWDISYFVSEMKYYSATEFTNPTKCPVSIVVDPESNRIPVPTRSKHRKFLFDLYSARNSDGYKRFLDVVGGAGIGLINDIKYQEVEISSVDHKVLTGGGIEARTKQTMLVVPQFKIGKNTLSPNQLSEGTFKTLTLLFYLMTDESSALLIEEPEVCVHHGLLASIIELIKTYSQQKQIIVSTHSDYVLDKVSPRNVCVVQRSDEYGTSVDSIEKSMSSSERSSLTEYLLEEGNLGEYWRDGGFE